MWGSSRRELEQNGAVGDTESQSGKAKESGKEQLELCTATKARERGQEGMELSVGNKATAVAATEAMVCGGHKLDQLDPKAQSGIRR